jgi:hypothetical protein
MQRRLYAPLFSAFLHSGSESSLYPRDARINKPDVPHQFSSSHFPSLHPCAKLLCPQRTGVSRCLPIPCPENAKTSANTRRPSPSTHLSI